MHLGSGNFIALSTGVFLCRKPQGGTRSQEHHLSFNSRTLNASHIPLADLEQANNLSWGHKVRGERW